MSKRGNAATLTRRAILAGGVLSLGCPREAFSLAPSDPVRIGVLSGLGLQRDDIANGVEALWGRPATIVVFRAWGALRDHAGASRGGLIDGAVLPRPADGGVFRRIVMRTTEAVLVFATGAADRHAAGSLPTLGVALAHPPAGTAIAGALRAAGLGDGGHAILEMPPDALVDNVAAGLIDAAVLVGEAVTGTCAARGLATVPLRSGAMFPPLALVRCDAASDAPFAWA